MKKTPKRFGNSEARLHKIGNQATKKNMDNAIKSLKTRIEKLDEKEKPKENQIIKIDIYGDKEAYINIIKVNKEYMYKTAYMYVKLKQSLWRYFKKL